MSSRFCRSLGIAAGCAMSFSAAGGQSIERVEWSGLFVTRVGEATSEGSTEPCDRQRNVLWAGAVFNPPAADQVLSEADSVQGGAGECASRLRWSVAVSAGLPAFVVESFVTGGSSAEVVGTGEVLLRCTEWTSEVALPDRLLIQSLLFAQTVGNVELRLVGPLDHNGDSLGLVDVSASSGLVPPVGTTAFADGLGVDLMVPGMYRLELAGSAAEDSSFGIGGGSMVQYDARGPITGTSGPIPACGAGGPCGDVDGDGDTDTDDLLAWLAAPVDTDGDGNTDADPYGADAVFLAAQVFVLDPPADDCNDNGFADVYDIAVGPGAGGSEDVDNDGVPDECFGVSCNAADQSPPFGVMNIDDLLVFLERWANGNPLADIAPPGAPDGLYNVDDLFVFLDSFAASCPLP